MVGSPFDATVFYIIGIMAVTGIIGLYAAREEKIRFWREPSHGNIDAMGMTDVKLIVKNPKNPKIQVEDTFLVDSGAGFTVLPSKIVEKLNLKPIYEKEFSLADGTTVKRKVGSALIEYKGLEVPAMVVLGKANDSKLLGVITLENMGLVLDPFQRKLHQAKMMM